MRDILVKQWSIAIPLIVYSLLVFWLLKYTISQPNNVILLVVTLMVSLLWVASTALLFSVLEQISIVITFITALPVFLAIIGRVQLGSIGAAALLVILLSGARLHIRSEIKNRIRFKIRPIFYVGSKLLITGLVLATAGLAMPTLTSELRHFEITIPQSTIQAIAKPFEQSTALNELNDLNQSISTSLTDQVNRHLNNVTERNPVMAAVIVLSSVVLSLIVITPLATIPALVLIYLLGIVAQKVGLISKVNNEVIAERLAL